MLKQGRSIQKSMIKGTRDLKARHDYSYCQATHPRSFLKFEFSRPFVFDADQANQKSLY